MAFLVLYEDVLGSGILFVHHLEHLFVYHAGSGVGVWTLEGIFLVVVIAYIRQLVAHT